MHKFLRSEDGFFFESDDMDVGFVIFSELEFVSALQEIEQSATINFEETDSYLEMAVLFL